jgi:hypothetical protein
MNYSDAVELFGLFLLPWFTGFSGAILFKTFNKTLQVST